MHEPAKPHRAQRTGFAVACAPSRTRYKTGQRIEYAGVRALYDGRDVTGDVAFYPPEGTPWPAKERAIEVRATYVDHVGGVNLDTFSLRRKRPLWPVLLALLAAVLVGGPLMLIGRETPARGETGSRLIAVGDADDVDIRAMLDERVEKSRMTVSLAPVCEFDRADGSLWVNFIVVPDNNGFSERLEIEQEGAVVYASGVVEPGYTIERAHAPDVRAGSATATVYAVDSSGNDHGNPVSVEIEIVEG